MTHVRNQFSIKCKLANYLVFNQASPESLLASSLVRGLGFWAVDRVDHHHPKLVQRPIIPDIDITSGDLLNIEQVVGSFCSPSGL